MTSSKEAQDEQRPSSQTPEHRFDENTTLEELRQHMTNFSKERNWGQFHIPRNLLIALNGEIGELNELFQWRHDGECKVGLPGWTEREKEHLGEELSDCLLYLTSLANACHIDLPKAAKRKIIKNAQKYPVSKSYNNARKYTELGTNSPSQQEDKQ